MTFVLWNCPKAEAIQELIHRQIINPCIKNSNVCIGQVSTHSIGAGTALAVSLNSVSHSFQVQLTHKVLVWKLSTELSVKIINTVCETLVTRRGFIPGFPHWSLKMMCEKGHWINYRHPSHANDFCSPSTQDHLHFPGWPLFSIQTSDSFLPVCYLPLAPRSGSHCSYHIKYFSKLWGEKMTRKELGSTLAELEKEMW